VLLLFIDCINIYQVSGNMAGAERDVRAKERLILRRDQLIARIRQIHALATSSASDQSIRAQLAVAVVDLDSL